MSQNLIIQKLLETGQDLFNAPAELVRLTHDSEANSYLNDLQNTPHAFVIGCVVDRQMSAEKAWMIPYKLAELIGSKEFAAFESLSQERLEQLMTRPKPLHRFSKDMAVNVHSAIQKISNTYQGDASNMWSQSPSSADVIFRFLEIRGVGQKIATMAANILTREFKVEFSDHFSIDVSADVHVCRVFERLGFVSKNASKEQVIYKARAIHPEFPGILDFPCFNIGRTWCRPRNPDCGGCYMGDICPSSESS
jgi:endonuclease-3